MPEKKTIIDLAIDIKKGDAKIDDVPKGIRKRVQAIANDTDLDLESYRDVKPRQRVNLSQRPRFRNSHSF